MGRDWYHWGGKSSKKTAGEPSAAGKPPPPPPPPPPGCMAAVFHLFHSRGLHLRLQTPDDDDEPSPTQFGLQPTINSSVAEEVMVGATASETEPLPDKNSNNRVGVGTREISSGRFITAVKIFPKLLTINTKRREGETVKTGEGQSSSDSRTPGVVARLMGLDLFPEGYVSSPRPSDFDPPHMGGRSGPDVVSGDRRVLDRFGERRLSVQVRRGAKEVSVALSRHSCSEIGGERRSVRSPSTREAVKHVKETASRRRFGADITNRTGQRRDEFLMSRIGNDAKQGVRSVESGSPGARVLEEPTSDVKCSWSDLYTSSRKHQQAIREQKPVTRNYHNSAKESNVGVGRQPRSSKREEQFFDVVVAHSTPGFTKQFKKQHENTPTKSEVCRGTLAPRLFLSRKLEKEKQNYPCKAITKGKAHPTKPAVTKALQRRTNAYAPPLPATPPFGVAADTEKDTRVSTRATRPMSRAQVLELGFQETRTLWAKAKKFSQINYKDLQDINVVFRLNHPDLGPGPGSVLVNLEREEEEVVREIEREIVDQLVHDTFVGVLW